MISNRISRSLSSAPRISASVSGSISAVSRRRVAPKGIVRTIRSNSERVMFATLPRTATTTSPVVVVAVALLSDLENVGEGGMVVDEESRIEGSVTVVDLER